MHSLKFISEYISSGFEVILTVDSNEHIVKGKLAQQLRLIGLKEAYCAKSNSDGSPTLHFRDRHQIDGVWCTSNIVPAAISLYPFNFGAGDHHAYAVNFDLHNILGKLAMPLCTLNKRRLIYSFRSVVQRYLTCVETQLNLHNILNKLRQLKADWYSLSPL